MIRGGSAMIGKDDRLGRITWEAELPADLKPGKARLVTVLQDDDRGSPLQVTVR